MLFIRSNYKTYILKKHIYTARFKCVFFLRFFDNFPLTSSDRNEQRISTTPLSC